MIDPYKRVEKKVQRVFAELAADRAGRLTGPCTPGLLATVAAALSKDFGPKASRDIAFHLVDWCSDAAFIVAVCLAPERFTPDEIAAGANLLLLHVPNHLAAAAKLADCPVKGIFQVGIECRSKHKIKKHGNRKAIK